jgi:hypothetical protein
MKTTGIDGPEPRTGASGCKAVGAATGHATLVSGAIGKMDIRRLPDGSVDQGFYDARARRIRSRAWQLYLRKLLAVLLR